MIFWRPRLYAAWSFNFSLEVVQANDFSGDHRLYAVWSFNFSLEVVQANNFLETTGFTPSGRSISAYVARCSRDEIQTSPRQQLVG